jgi:hypothetical protein
MREHTRYVVTFAPAPGVNGVRSLRWMLKAARRRYGLIAVDAREIQDTPTNIADAFVQLRNDVRARRRERS